MTFHTKVKVDAQRVQDMFIGAFEGGSNYWLGNGRVELVRPKHEDLPADGVVWYGNSKLNPFAQTNFYMTIQHDGEEIVVDTDKINDGLQVMAEKYARHFADMSAENDDADTHDVFLQCVCFGEVIYG